MQLRFALMSVLQYSLLTYYSCIGTMVQCNCLQRSILRLLLYDVRCFRHFRSRKSSSTGLYAQLPRTVISSLPKRLCYRENPATVSTSQVRKQFISNLSRPALEAIESDLARATQVVQDRTVPSEAAVSEALQICEDLAKVISESTETSEMPQNLEKTPTSNLLTLEQQGTQQRRLKKPLGPNVEATLRDRVADTAYRIVTHPNTFLSPSLLKIYVNTQATLHRPQSFPRVFDLYAAKPIPRAGSSPVTYKDSNPDDAKAAIPLSIAKSALKAGIEVKNLALCLNIITTTVATTAFKRAKYLRKALFPTIALALSPGAAYMLGKAFADFQERLDPVYATWMGTAGFMTYFSMTALTGYIAITTANDHMDRVTWRVGTPLYQRWLREEERAFTDQVAQAWGFQDYLKRGQEEGKDWRNLKQWVMERDMDLDKPELMEGME